MAIHFQSGVLTFSLVSDLICKTSPSSSSYFGKFTCFHFWSCLSLIPAHQSPRSVSRADRWGWLSMWLAAGSGRISAMGTWGNEIQLWQKKGKDLFWQSVQWNGTSLSHICRWYKLYFSLLTFLSDLYILSLNTNRFCPLIVHNSRQRSWSTKRDNGCGSCAESHEPLCLAQISWFNNRSNTIQRKWRTMSSLDPSPLTVNRSH